MIEYEYLCEAITAWKEGRRLETPPAPGGEFFAAAEPLDGGDYEVADGHVQEYAQAEGEYAEPQADYGQPEAHAEYDAGAPVEVAASGTEPIPAGQAPEGAPPEGWEQQAAPEPAPYNPELQTPGYAEEPSTAEFAQAAAEDVVEDVVEDVAFDVDEALEVDDDLEVDEDDEDEEDDYERDYDLEEVDDMAAFDFNADLHGYFQAEFVVEQAWEDKATRIATLNRYGIRDEAHYHQVKATLERYVQTDEAETRWGGLDAIMQIQVNARTDYSMGEMQARAQGELAGELEPVEGISLEQWAHAQAGLASGGDAAEIIAGLGIDQAHWDRVSAEWNARMSRDTTATIATEYGKAFSTAGQGQFAGAAAETAGALQPGGDVGDEPPVPLERYVEIQVAQAAAAEQGRDPSEVLAGFGITPMEFGQIGGWWGNKIARHGMEDGQALLNRFNELQEHYEAQYATADADEDVEF